MPPEKRLTVLGHTPRVTELPGVRQEIHLRIVGQQLMDAAALPPMIRHLLLFLGAGTGNTTFRCLLARMRHNNRVIVCLQRPNASSVVSEPNKSIPVGERKSSDGLSSCADTQVMSHESSRNRRSRMASVMNSPARPI